MIRTERGYRANCLKCGALGPERDSQAEAWDALLDAEAPEGFAEVVNRNEQRDFGVHP